MVYSLICQGYRGMQILEAADKIDGKYISSVLSTGNYEGGFQCMGRTETEKKMAAILQTTHSNELLGIIFLF